MLCRPVSVSAQYQVAKINIPILDIPRLPDPHRDTITICILGDIMMHAQQIEHAKQKHGTYEFESYFKHLKEVIQSADIAIANMEFTLAGEPYSGYPCFSAPDSFATYLKDCGFDVFLSANNHIYDKGAEGALRTVSIYRSLGVEVAGIAENKEAQEKNFPLIVKIDGTRIAIINATYGTNSGIGSFWPRVNYINSKESLLEAFKKAEECDITLAFPHWGDEYQLTHSASQKATANWMIDSGADAIIGAHPHVVQDMEYIDTIPVFYSLGNTVSNMSATNTQVGLMVTLKIEREGKRTTKLLEPEITYLWCSRPGGYTDNYTVLPIASFIGTKEQWQGTWEYDKMVSTYERVKPMTGIEE